MVTAEWGLKRTCLSCEAKFYDMRKDPIICPACEAPFDPNAASKLKRTRPPGGEKAPGVSTKGPADTAEKDIDEPLDDDGDEAVLEDTSDLDSNDDMHDVKPTKSDEGED